MSEQYKPLNSGTEQELLFADPKVGIVKNLFKAAVDANVNHGRISETEKERMLLVAANTAHVLAEHGSIDAVIAGAKGPSTGYML